MFFPVFSFASFPIPSDTIQIQKETKEEYKLRLQNQGMLQSNNSESVIKNKWKSTTIGQRVLIILALIIFLLYQALKNADFSGFFWTTDR